MADVTVHLRRNLERYEREGDAERVKAIKARLAESEEPQEVLSVDEVREIETASEPELSMLNSKAELLEAAEGLDVDESNTKAEILEALEGES